MNKKGYVLLLVILGAISLAFFSLTLSSLNQGYRSQVQHTKQMQACFQIAYSGFQKILGKMYLKPWEERFFKNGPKTENGLALFGGNYDTYVQDAPGQTNQADIFVRVKLEGATRNYVWRVEHIPDLLDSKYFRTLFYEDIPENQYPTTSGGAPYSQVINDCLEKRDLNKAQAESLRAQIAGLNDSQDIAALLGAPAPQISGTNSLPPVRPGIVPPALDPLSISEPAGPETLLTNPKPRTPYLSAEQLAAKLESGGKAIVRQISFEFERYALKPESTPALQEVFKLLQNKPTLKISIDGHTDNSGDPSYNQNLSEQRARSVFNWLVGKGVSSGRLNVHGYGEFKPMVSNGTAQGRAKNRRVELVAMP